jgi:hypothetical protein
MPAFVNNGPDIPECLLQAHEDGRVVFFCGAGISYPAKLPGFAKLVEKLYVELGATPNRIQKAAIKSKQYDTAIGLLESDFVGGREEVRKALSKILTPNLSSPKATATHEALLELGRNRAGQLRLVTTNFDRLFEEVIERESLNIECCKAPMLPVPKNRWSGLVYLHGLLPTELNTNKLDRLIVSSGDFGLAYLTERWASRFVSELFRNFTVCFVGYSINDPVLRYMMDALAADRLLGESPPKIYAFGSYSKGKEDQCSDEWHSKNVTPILYRMHNRHAYLHKTLHAWASTYRDGVRGKQMIIAQHAPNEPLGPHRSDFSVGRVLWALTDILAAKHFAELVPVPPLKWLEPLSEAQFDSEDLSRFGVIPKPGERAKLPFSVIRRPTPYNLSPMMCIVDSSYLGSDWDEVMLHLARWLTRHLDDPKLAIWLAKQGGRLHEQLAGLIKERIEKLDRLKKDRKKDELDQILLDSPKAKPGPLMRIIWRILLAGRLKSQTHHFLLFNWMDRFRQDGLTPTLRMELREALSPCITLREPFRDDELENTLDEPKNIRDIVYCEFVLKCDEAHTIFDDLDNNAKWQDALPYLLEDFTALLRDTLDLMRELGEADDTSDSSYFAQPSISRHPQNTNFRDWTVLIDLTRDSWLAMVKRNPEKARITAESWWQIPYPLFKRLSFFCTASTDLITTRKTLDWLLSDGKLWLWSDETKREAIRLIVALASKLDVEALAELEEAILNGPTLEMSADEIDSVRWDRYVDHEVWLRLSKIESTGAALREVSKSKLRDLRKKYPNWKLAQDNRDEFPYWMGMGDGDEWRKIVSAPRQLSDLMNWLKESKTETWQVDDWRDRCHEDFSTAAEALSELAKQGDWPSDRWREAFQVWVHEELLERSWRFVGPIIYNAPDSILKSIAHSFSRWLDAQAKVFGGQEEIFFSLIRRVLNMKFEIEDDSDEPVTKAINHPIGVTTEAMIHWWYRQKPEDSQGLKGEIRQLFTQLCDTSIKQFVHGRVLLASQSIALFRVDADWTIKNLLPLFDWQELENEASTAWKGFLWSPRYYQPMLMEIKKSFLETVKYFGKLGKYDKQYAAFLTFVALDPGDAFKIKELKEVTHMLPPKGLQYAMQTVTRALEGSGEQRSEYWINRVLPYLRNVWPKSREVVTPAISESIGRLCIATKDNFPQAIQILHPWFQPVEYPGFLSHQLVISDLCQKFPLESLTFLNAFISDDIRWPPKELKKCLEDIVESEPRLSNYPFYLRLKELLERRRSF